MKVLRFALVALLLAPHAAGAHSIAREWNDLLLDAIRHDLARPTVHARNLFHTSVAMWDAWAAYDDFADTYLHHERVRAPDLAAARREAISFAAYRILSSRFASSVGAAVTIPALDAKMDALGYDRAFTSQVGDSPAALGNRIAAAVLAFGDGDGSNEQNDYANRSYLPVNPPILPAFPGNPDVADPNRWQPIALEFFIDQSGNPIPGGSPEFLSPEWGVVTPFALSSDDRTIYHRGGFDYWVYHDPGPPPMFGGARHDEYLTTFETVLEWSALLDPTDGVTLDVSPSARGNNTLGTNDGSGYAENPATGLPYDPQVVPAGDYYRILAEFWADGPDSETPPGHWFVIANEVADHPAFTARVGGVGPVLDPLEWDVKLYLTLGGAMHDVAISAWGAKGWYDYARPLSVLRFLADLGQRTDPLQPSYHPNGIALEPGRVEVVTLASIAPGERHEHLAGPANENLGKIAARAWRGPDFIIDPETDDAGVGWILVENWWPYQRPTFVTPPFAGYVSGHSTYSRAAAEVLTSLTGDPYFPGGLGEFPAPRNEFLVFEEGPSVDVTLQWAKYYDAADECSLSRIYGGIHPPADDIPGRFMGAVMGVDAVEKATRIFGPRPSITLQRAAAWPRRQDGGKVTFRGTLATLQYGIDDVLDVSGGLRLVAHDGLDLHEEAILDAEGCEVRRNGKIRCRSADRTVKAVFKPSKRVPGLYEFSVTIKGRNFGEPLGDALVLEIENGDPRWGGKISCSARTGKTVCRTLPASGPPVTPTASPSPTATPAASPSPTATAVPTATPAPTATPTPEPVCGNGVVEPGEFCDDGNVADGDCCSSLCESEPAGTSCSDDGNACTVDACNGTGTCTHADVCAWHFADVTATVGLVYEHAYDEAALVNPELERAIISGGVAVGDYDRDGWDDLFVVGGPLGGDRLLRNDGGAGFVDVTGQSGIDRPGGFGSGPLFADYDGDGWLDLVVGGVNETPIAVYRNLGTGRFSDATLSAGLAFDGTTFGGAFGDYDLDGDLDLYLAHWQTPIADSPRLWRNNGNGTFTDVTVAAEIGVHRGPVPIDQGFTPNFADINSDGWPDLLVASDFGASQVFLNDGDTTFTETTTPVISDENGMGAAVGDYDNDGDLDWFVTSITDPDGVPEGFWGLSGNRMYRNLGDGTFEDVTDLAGVREGFWGWAACMADFDLDGNPDFFHVNGFGSDSADDFYADPSRLFLATGDGSFEEVSADVGLFDDGQGRGVSCFDYDNDGDVDILVANNDQAPRLWENRAEVLGRRYLEVRLVGNYRNSQAIGARVYVTTAASTQMREIRAGSNFASQDPASAHFGLGLEPLVSELRVVWPDGEVTTMNDVAADQRLELTHPLALGGDDPSTPTTPRFVCLPGAVYCNESVAAGLSDMTRYARGAAVVDVDGDGIEDLFLVDSDSRWSPTSWGVSQLFRNEGGAKFVPIDIGIDDDDLRSTWTATFADYDNDGDPDVLLVNGGYAGEGNLALYENRLNEAEASFVSVTTASNVEAIANGAPSAWWGASWADYDLDGHLDVAITRLAGSVLVLHNEGNGTFSDAGAALGVTVLHVGQGKNPVWFDYDEDGDPDLYVAGLFVHALYRNDAGVSFVDQTTLLGPPLPGALAPWVFAAAVADFDQDGLEDLYLGRQGLQDFVLRNDGQGGFEQWSSEIGLDAIVTENTMGLGVGDLFDDGWPDVFVGTGEPSTARPDLFFCNVGGGTFERCGFEFYDGADGPWRTRAHGTVFGDFDENGATDVLLNLGGATGFDASLPEYDSRQAPALYLHQGPPSSNTASVRLVGTSSNRDAIGARIRVDGESIRYQAVRSMQGFQSQNGRWLRLSLGDSSAGAVTVRWPSGVTSSFDVAAGDRVEVVEP